MNSPKLTVEYTIVYSDLMSVLSSLYITNICLDISSCSSASIIPAVVCVVQCFESCRLYLAFVSV